MVKPIRILDNWFDKHLSVGQMVRDIPYVLVFKTTNFCWYKCPHCCECSGPDQPKRYIPAHVIRYYIETALQDPQFSKSVVFTGGEIFSSYKFGEHNYVPKLLRTCTNNKISVDIKTNAGWAHTDFGGEIVNDLTNVIHSSKPYAIQISMSLDRYHKNSVNNVSHVISQLAKNDCKVNIFLSSFAGMENMYDELKKQLKKSGVPVKNMMMFQPCFPEIAQDADVVNNCVMLNFSSSVPAPFANGRAKNLPNAIKSEFPQFEFLSRNNDSNSVLVAFDSFGRVTLGENSGRKIGTNWLTDNKMARHMYDIQRSLVRNARYEEIRAIVKENWRPVPISRVPRTQ